LSLCNFPLFVLRPKTALREAQITTSVPPVISWKRTFLLSGVFVPRGKIEPIFDLSSPSG
jgi:hypothetical protein